MIKNSEEAETGLVIFIESISAFHFKKEIVFPENFNSLQNRIIAKIWIK